VVFEVLEREKVLEIIRFQNGSEEVWEEVKLKLLEGKKMGLLSTFYCLIEKI
jgi:hypothetical protein